MNEEAHITRRDMELIVENLSLKISARVEKKLDEFAENLHQSNIDRRNSTVHEVTGFEWRERNKIKAGVQHAYRSSVNKDETESVVKKAFIGYTLPLGIGGFFMWVVENWNKLTGQ